MTDYIPPKTIRQFMLSDKLARFVTGPLGSGKSLGCIMEMTRRMREQAPDNDGNRLTRWAVVRNTLQQIRDTCLKDILQWLGPIAQLRVSDNAILFNIPLIDNTTIKSEWLLRPIDTEQDLQRLLSLQLTGAWCSEFRELPYKVVAGVLGRVGRYPRGNGASPTWEGLIAESNPFSEGSEWFENLVTKLPSEWAYFRQPGGLSADAENRANLPKNYYERLMEGHDEEWIRVHVHAEFGDDLSGQPVFKSSFNPDIHVSGTALEINRMRPLIIMQDLGRTPTCLIGQLDVFGRLLVLAECLSQDRNLHQFVAEVLLPVLNTERFTGCPRFAVYDPQGFHKTQFNDENATDIFAKYGIASYPASTNDIDPRLRAVEGFLVSLRGGKPALIIDGRGCPNLAAALRFHYKYKRKKDGEIEDKPEKKHPWSDLADALQYGCLAVQHALPTRYMQSFMYRPNFPQAPPVGAWT